MQALFVHGMGRSPLSGWPLLRQLQRAGLKTATFGYLVSVDDFSSITARLVSRIEQLAAGGDYILIGHSLGGVLLRAAVGALPPGSGNRSMYSCSAHRCGRPVWRSGYGTSCFTG
ncbi:esterase/lipase family protein [Dechloromonas sp. A34]|uniref:esterase/lipase family protein n=1 Tax=Dechloromonas sp. A34 TaxID=447588 RepID=UPI00224920E6|nr:alpha/beta hydrolase [Dechloromonas sp. A34]